MRVLIITQYIYPENFKSNDLAFELAKRGHHIDVLTGIPNYPEGVYFKGYGVFKKRIEHKDGVNFYRCIQTPRGRKASGLGLACNYMSFVFFATLWVFFYFAWRKRYDAIITHEPSPITQLIPAVILGKIRRTPVYSWIMDIWPDSVSSSVSRNIYKKIEPILTWLTELTYQGSHKILITSKSFEELICRHHDYKDKIIYFPNWSNDMSCSTVAYNIPDLPKGFIIMTAGNLGEAQNLDAVGECIKLLKDNTEIKWVFVGDGSWKKWLDDFIDANDLSECAYTLGSYPLTAMPSFFEKANAMLVTLRGGYSFLDATVPARLQSYMSSGRPILAMLGKGGADLITESDCGYAVAPGDYEALAEVINKNVLTNKAAFEQKGKNGRKFYEQSFMLDDCITNLEQILLN